MNGQSVDDPNPAAPDLADPDLADPDLDAPTDADPVPDQGPPTGDDVDAQERQHQPADLRMGHDIARAMAHHPPERAAEEIATHLRKFWDPRMRATILARVDRGEPMDDLLRAGVELLREGEIDPSEVRKPSGG
ncbi:formate dehydrogenase subunit delta [Ornithinimicrobium sp. CNJ-824]|jgi:hypothetical protein|uniref:formate dehydrogenase subunit delta n=1 Tax=Ornithinimicrobium sp. CNJ-824 TaxID=1904966 RepID=UPI00096A2FAB|nr:formate dehydrogenase subunit delta [Ornithinimicrobium sp. CNJ-824]